ncbi:MAG: biotin transporter BioY [Candidatus Omnitrophica bacterium]|nr:biotin transporter BioY [Candidatus Omnitrophota bacterium]MCM8809083.1 biotin transporter BioY [Candidatus Omnitrophota bacterium]MCM8811306.1 biotin transporter BioY [Candidatus Omnitrophota bacterium]
MIKKLWIKIWYRYFEIYKILGIAEKILLSIIFSILTGLSAQIYVKLPFTPVPITLQTFTVLLSGILLGKNYGCLSQIFYFIGGVSGIGWFYGGTAGFLRPTTGYVIGFIFASYIAGYFSERKNKIIGMIIASLTIYFFGIIWLKLFYPVKNLILIGVLPFIPFDIIKGLIAGLFTESIKRGKDEKI